MSGSPGPTPERERQRREAALDETIEQSFPASDPLSTDPNPDSGAALAEDVLKDEAGVSHSASSQPLRKPAR
jgi:hypothetical protein